MMKEYKRNHRGHREFLLFILSVLSVVRFLTGGFAFAEEGFKYDAKGKRDPFVPLASTDGVYVSDAYGISGIADIRLEGIVWDEVKGSVAIINGEIVREGQDIGMLKVIKIETGSVIFDVDGEEVKVDLRDE